MKVGGTFYLWGIITVSFFKWAAAQYRSGDAAEDRAASAAAGHSDVTRTRPPVAVAAVGSGRQSPMPEVLTWDHVAEELARTPPAPPGDSGG